VGGTRCGSKKLGGEGGSNDYRYQRGQWRGGCVGDWEFWSASLWAGGGLFYAVFGRSELSFWRPKGGCCVSLWGFFLIFWGEVGGQGVSVVGGGGVKEISVYRSGVRGHWGVNSGNLLGEKNKGGLHRKPGGPISKRKQFLWYGEVITVLPSWGHEKRI